MSKETRYCTICGEPMLKRPQAIYCSIACQQKAKRNRFENRVKDIVLKADTVPVLEKEKAQLKAGLLEMGGVITELQMTSDQKIDRVLLLERLINGQKIVLKYFPDDRFGTKAIIEKYTNEIISLNLE